MKKSVLLMLAVMMLGVLAMAQGAGQASQPLANQSVIEMVHAGVAEDIIISKVQNSAANYDLSTDGLIALSKEKVPNSVIKAMIEAQASFAAPSASTAPADAAPASTAPVAAAPVDAAPMAAAPMMVDDPNLPDTAHNAGIYMFTNAGGAPQMTQLSETTYTEGKTTGLLASALTNGITKVKWLAVVRGTQAQVRAEKAPVFYFYFDEGNRARSRLSNASPNEFTLLRFDVKEDSRETVVMSANAFGASGGVDEKKTVPFNFVQVRPGMYKVTPTAPLAPGEYAFLLNRSTVPYRGRMAPPPPSIFDFGVN
jgi:hypothetical protein